MSPLTVAPGTRLGPYEIVALIGVGGMGEVYRATDTNLARQVAIKVLPEAVASDPERLARFDREAKTLAALNHPNIAAIYGLEKSDGTLALVMELVEGPTLADRIAQGAIPLADALPIARQIAEALEAAHEQGIIHRDLKPANIALTAQGQVKVLDFGLAKALDPVGSTNVALTNSPTLSLAATQAGIILGTAAYMAPEQARGKAADKRADIWAFGVVLFEILTARRAFEGDDISITLASVLKSDPDWSALPPTTPTGLRRLLSRCLKKDPKDRLQAIGDARIEIGDMLSGAPEAVTSPAIARAVPVWRRGLPVALALIAGAVLTGAVAWGLRPSPAPSPVSRSTMTLPQDQLFTNMSRQIVAISPDGAHIVYVANSRLYLRSMSEFEARPIPGTEIVPGLVNPVFSPDGKAIAFFSGADSTLKRIAVSGGAAVTLCPAGSPYGMSWTDDGLVFGQGAYGILRVSASGGKPELLVRVKDNELAFGPQILPGGQWVLFTLATGTSADRWDKAQIVVQSLKTGERKTLVEGGSDGRYLPTGHLVYALGGTLFAMPFDLRRLQVTSGPTPIVEGVRRAVATGTAQFSVSGTGSLAYLPGPASTASAQSDLALYDRKGVAEPLKLPPGGAYAFPRVSPDGKRVAFEMDGNVGIYDLAGTSAIRRITFGGHNQAPVWSADGERVAFQSDREGDAGIWWQRADGTGTAERLTKPEPGTSHLPESWWPKGDRFLFSVTKGATKSLWVYSMPDRTPTAFDSVTSPIGEFIGSAFSPDGKWVAYASTSEGGVFVQPFPPTGARYQVSKSGFAAVWSRDGRELFYLPTFGQFAIVSVTTQPTFGVGNPVLVPRAIPNSPTIPRAYDLSVDGRFIGASVGGTQSGTVTSQVQVVENWLEELKARVPTK